MKYTVILLLCVSFAQVKLEDDDHGHEHGGGREHLIDEIAEQLKTSTKSPENHTVFTYKDIQKLFKGLNFKNCSNSRSPNASCNLVSYLRFVSLHVIKVKIKFRRLFIFVCFCLVSNPKRLLKMV